MNNSAKYVLVLLVLSAGCERQIPVAENMNINGYEVQGTVTDQVGNPVPNVKVLLDYYNGDLIYADTVATRRYFVSDPSVSVQAVVVNWSNQMIRTLTAAQNFHGWYQVLWDGKDSTGSIPPSGIYYVEYLVDGTARFSYNQLVSGGQVATTNAKGRYTIPIQNLPVDSSSVPVFSTYDSTYIGNFLISNEVILTFQYLTHAQQLLRPLSKGQVTIIDVVFH